MKHLLVSILIAAMVINLKVVTIAQQVTTDWVVNDFDGYPVGVMTALDPDENLIVTGHAGDFTSIITSKFDSEGNIIWKKLYSLADIGVAATWLSVDPSGNIIVTGYPRTFSSNPVETGLLTLKYDNDGNLLWDRLIAGTWALAIRSVTDSSGNIYVTGRDWQHTATYDFVTVKYAPDGTQLWYDTFDQNQGFHTPAGMDLDQWDNLFITGGSLSGGLITVMYDSMGSRQWIREEQGSAGQTIKADRNGGIFVTGSFYDVNTGTGNDLMILKYDVSGGLLWQKFYDFGGYEYGKLVNIDSQSNIYITGFSVMPGEFAGWLTSRFDPSGNLLWSETFKLNQNWEEYPYFAMTGPEDELYVTGNVGLSSSGTIYNGLETIRYNSDGTNPWVAEAEIYAGIGKGLALGNDQSVYAVGQYYYSVIKYSQSNITGISAFSAEPPGNFDVKPNYPNPFTQTSTVLIELTEPCYVNLSIVDMAGQKVREMQSGRVGAGQHVFQINAEGFSPGIYFYTIQAGNKRITKKMVIE